jgi:hypothetical protein
LALDLLARPISSYNPAPFRRQGFWGRITMTTDVSVPTIDQYEKLASFYLGRHYDLEAKQQRDSLLMYDAKDLCTHAMCVGMTGSGKTGLCLSLLEEAALDGLPVICVDPKGDLSNLLLTFPELRPEDFQPWLDPGQAARKGIGIEQLADETANSWRAGLASWGISPDRIRRFQEGSDVCVYTPGSQAGMPLTVLRSFDAPPAQLLEDGDAFRERITDCASGLLALMGVPADPLRSPPHILLASILEQRWRAGQDVAIADLVGLIQRPPIQRVGVLDLEAFMPASERTALAMQLNNLLASPAFAGWLEGEPLSIERLLYTAEGQPRVSILSIAHLNDSERMFFLTILLGELLAWVRTQSGTSSLRALFYMDEVAGYFPPVANPPTKPPMLTLLKQARAFGLGITLATQNPVDLDYKGLSNIGTWFIGRLQTERDKARVLDGLEGAALQAGSGFDRRDMERLLSALGNRVFLMNNVHNTEPTLFQTRWAMSFLAGPLARGQIAQLMAARKQRAKSSAAAPSEVDDSAAAGDPATESPTVLSGAASDQRAILPPELTEWFVASERPVSLGYRGVYRPALFAKAAAHYVRAAAKVDLWRDCYCLLTDDISPDTDAWQASLWLTAAPEVLSDPESGIEFSLLPPGVTSAGLKKIGAQLKDHIYRHHPLQLYRSPLLKQFASPGTSQGEARVELGQQLRELRDRETDRIRNRYGSKFKSLENKIYTAQERVEREKSMLKQTSLSSVINLGTTVLGTFLGNKVSSRSMTSKTGSLLRGASQAAKKKSDAGRAEEALMRLQEELRQLEQDAQSEIDQLAEVYDVHRLELEVVSVPMRKADFNSKPLVLVWLPWEIGPTGECEPLFELELAEP